MDRIVRNNGRIAVGLRLVSGGAESFENWKFVGRAGFGEEGPLAPLYVERLPGSGSQPRPGVAGG